MHILATGPTSSDTVSAGAAVAILAVVLGALLLLAVAGFAVVIMTDPGRSHERLLRMQIAARHMGLGLEEVTKKIRRDAIVIAVVSFVAGGLLTLGITLFVHPLQ